MTTFSPGMTLEDAREQLRPLLTDGHRCPCCTQFAKVYKRKVHATMARTLIVMFRKGGSDWVYLPDIPQKSRDSTGMAWWGLIEEEAVTRPDGGRAGWWRVTDLGRDWVMARVKIDKYARIYDGRCLGHIGEQVSIQDALGDKFDYGELMGW